MLAVTVVADALGVAGHLPSRLPPPQPASRAAAVIAVTVTAAKAASLVRCARRTEARSGSRMAPPLPRQSRAAGAVFPGESVWTRDAPHPTTSLMPGTTLVFARAQMEVSLAFHMVFAALGIGMPLLMVIAEARYVMGHGEHFRELARTWGKATALLFAIGAVSGTALSFELGLLWPKLMSLAGPSIGPAFVVEGYAFFLEAIFVGLYLYGWKRLTPKQHLLVGVPVAASGLVSGILVVAANAWMQKPAGFTLGTDGAAVPTPGWRRP